MKIINKKALFFVDMMGSGRHTPEEEVDQVVEDLKYVEKEKLDVIDAFTVSELYFKLDKIPESQQVVEKVLCDSRINYFFNNLRKSGQPRNVIEDFIATLEVTRKDKCV
jgi:hypothetical protein